MQKEGFYIARWRESAEASLAWGDCATWSDLDFEKLGNLFLERTGTMLSITTLKRIWGKVKYDSTPNAATLNALARFSGFEDWRAFKQSVDAEACITTPEVFQPRPTPKKKNRLPAILAIAAMLVVLIGIIAWIIKPGANTAQVKFEAHVVAEGLPNSVVFNYDASDLQADSITLQQTWDPNRTESISATDKQHTSIYYYPGYFTAKLIANGKTKKETPVYIKTNGWQGIVTKMPSPAYLSNADIRLPGALGISAKTLAAKTGSAVFNGQWTGFYNVKEFDGLDGGDFTLDATLRNTSTAEQSSCRNVIIYILGKQNAIILPLANKGCISGLSMFTSSDWINGKTNDLSAFGCDFSQFQKISCSVSAMRLKVNLNGQQILDTPITQTIKTIAGICISFEGTGEIKTVKLANSSKVVLNEDFTKTP